MNKYGLYDIFADKWLKDCDSIWVYSDLHLGDLESYILRGIINVISKEQFESLNYGCDYTYDDFISKLVEQADKEQIKRINAKCGKNSCLIILGDVGSTEHIKDLKAKYKILLLGNHDKGASNYKRTVELKQFNYDDSDNETVFKLEEEAIKQGFKLDGYTQFADHLEKRYSLDNHLFDEVYEGPLMINDRLILSHEPIMNLPSYMFNIHGHVHDAQYKGDKYHLNCCAEVINYEPINLTKLLKKGLLKNIDSIHRQTIDIATQRKKRGDSGWQK